MSKAVAIEPCSRLEGHGKVTLHLDDSGNLTDARFHVMEFRGFEKFCEGRKIWELPRITPRSCGICPVSHHLASAKACDDLYGVDIPPAAKLTRELMHMGQIIHSHALHFFYLAAPDFFFPTDATKRNIQGVLEAYPDMGKKAIELRKCGQEMVHITGGKKIHPVTALPGGVSKPITEEEKQKLSEYVQKAKQMASELLSVSKKLFNVNANLINSFAPIKTNYLGMVQDKNLALYDGKIVAESYEGNQLAEFQKDYLSYIDEKVAAWSYLKFPYLKNVGWPSGMYRVGPLARVNVADQIATPLADQELKEFREFFGSQKHVHGTLQYHWARFIEIVYAIERAEEIINDPQLLSKEVRQKLETKAGEGVGIIEAPRGTLIHHYKCDDTGTVTMANMIVATIGNNGGINMSVKEAAKQYISGGEITEPAMNMVEMAVRAYDPCLSCSTHAIGQMPLNISLHDSKNNVIDEKFKGN